MYTKSGSSVAHSIVVIVQISAIPKPEFLLTGVIILKEMEPVVGGLRRPGVFLCSLLSHQITPRISRSFSGVFLIVR